MPFQLFISRGFIPLFNFKNLRYIKSLWLFWKVSPANPPKPFALPPKAFLDIPDISTGKHVVLGTVTADTDLVFAIGIGTGVTVVYLETAEVTNPVEIIYWYRHLWLRWCRDLLGWQWNVSTQSCRVGFRFQLTDRVFYMFELKITLWYLYFEGWGILTAKWGSVYILSCIYSLIGLASLSEKRVILIRINLVTQKLFHIQYRRLVW